MSKLSGFGSPKHTTNERCYGTLCWFFSANTKITVHMNKSIWDIMSEGANNITFYLWKVSYSFFCLPLLSVRYDFYSFQCILIVHARLLTF